MSSATGLLDTSVVIAVARGEKIELPQKVAISVVTLCELHHGVLVASDKQRPGRLLTLTMVERLFDPLPVDDAVAPRYGRLVAEARRLHGARPRLADALIAATAIAHHLPLYARDRDFERIPGPELVIV